MKQRIFMMLAAMLLSIGAFAQSGNQPLKGDVNEDGRVDVADVVAIVDIILKGGSTPQPTTYYWYVGTTLPNETNIETIANETLTAKPTTWTAENPKSIAATNNTGESCPIYYCFPTDWNVVVLDEDKVTEMLLPDVSTFTYNNIEYTVKRTGRNIGNGSTKNYYAKC